MANADDATNRAGLRARARALESLANKARVFAGTLAERSLAAARADLAETLAAIDGGAPLAPLRDRLHGIAVAIGSALYMSGTNCADSTSVTDLTAQLAAWLGDA